MRSQLGTFHGSPTWDPITELRLELVGDVMFVCEVCCLVGLCAAGVVKAPLDKEFVVSSGNTRFPRAAAAVTKAPLCGVVFDSQERVTQH